MLAVSAVIGAVRFPNSSEASTLSSMPSFSLSGLAGSNQGKAVTYFRPGAGTQTLGSVAAISVRSDVSSLRAVGGVSPTSSLSSGVSVAAATSGEVGAGLKPLAEIIDPRSPIVEYQTQAGDTISGVATKFGVSVQTILDNNKTVTNANLLPRDMVLVIPRKDGILHKVGYGETVDSIVGQYDNISSSTVVEYKPNGISDPSNLESGKYLLLVGATPKPPPPPPPAAPGSPQQPQRPLGWRRCTHRLGRPLLQLPGRLLAWRQRRVWHLPRPRPHPRRDRPRPLRLRPSPLFSVCDGVVTRVEYLTYSYGYHVIIDCGEGWTTLHAHMSEIHVTPGQAVSAGTVLGLSGLTGYTTGHHLHFEIRYFGGPVDPRLYIGF
ncbi:MAG: LysM peptidoglycan-binding domain-containing M23 family metallopeptidase [Dehalococcoidia bacterium]|nr:LysM peptidoglycan-binding domain-containing M23 family metallopeptidase [Dehalococcoidia bacterium]